MWGWGRCGGLTKRRSIIKYICSHNTYLSTAKHTGGGGGGWFGGALFGGGGGLAAGGRNGEGLPLGFPPFCKQ